MNEEILNSEIESIVCDDGKTRLHIDTREKMIRQIKNKFEFQEYKSKENLQLPADFFRKIDLSNCIINIGFQPESSNLLDILVKMYEVKDLVLFERIESKGVISYGIKIRVDYQNCIIHTGGFENTIFCEEVRFDNAIFLKNASFYNSKFERDVSFQQVTFEKGLDFENAIFSGDIVFNHTKFKCHDIDFKNCKFNGEFRAQAIDFSFPDKSPTPYIDFSESEFHKDVDLSYITFDRACSFANSKIYGNFLFQKSQFLVSVDFFNTEIKGSILFSPSPADNELEVIPNTINKISFNRSKISDRIDFENCEIDLLEANFANISKGALFRIYESKINSLDFTSAHNDGILILENNHNNIDEITFESSINTGTIEIENTEAKTILDRKTARLLKDSAFKSGNTIDGLHYKAKEMALYQKELFASFKWTKIRSFLNELILLTLNRFSNKHGLSWSRGLIFTIAVWVLFYGVFIMSRDGIGDVFFLSIEENREGFIKYLWLPSGINDLFPDKPNAKKIGDLAIAIFIAGKIAIAYGIYQTITAFRKYKN